MTCPEYYLGKTRQEAWDAIEEFELNYNLGCAFKYLVRAGRKTEDPTDDLRKAVACIERDIAVKSNTSGVTTGDVRCPMCGFVGETCVECRMYFMRSMTHIWRRLTNDSEDKGEEKHAE